MDNRNPEIVDSALRTILHLDIILAQFIFKKYKPIMLKRYVKLI